MMLLIVEFLSERPFTFLTAGEEEEARMSKISLSRQSHIRECGLDLGQVDKVSNNVSSE